MPRIRLAHWHDGHAPGDVIDVDEDTCRALRRDGRVNEVLPEYAEGGFLPAAAEATNDTGEPEAVVPAPRKRKPAESQEE